MQEDAQAPGPEIVPQTDGVGVRAKYRHAFIVTYGRSGSTLLQGLLNALPGYLILGENFDAMRHIEALFRRLPRFGVQRSGDAKRREPSRPTHPFFGFENFNDAAFLDGLRLLVERVLTQDADSTAIRCLGFKEIRYSPTDVARKVAFLRSVFPGCAIIYNIRNPQDVIESEFQKDKEIAQFESFNALLAERSASDPDSFLVRYEDVARATGSLIGLHEFLGEPFDRARVEAVLAVKHSYHSKAQLYSDVPRFVQVNKSLTGLSLFVADRFDLTEEVVKVGGLLVRQDDADTRRFRKMLDERGRPVKFRANLNLPSPRLGERLRRDAARKARFQVSFTRRGPDEHRLFFDNDELALIVRADTPAAEPVSD